LTYRVIQGDAEDSEAYRRHDADQLCSAQLAVMLGLFQHILAFCSAEALLQLSPGRHAGRFRSLDNHKLLHDGLGACHRTRLSCDKRPVMRLFRRMRSHLHRTTFSLGPFLRAGAVDAHRLPWSVSGRR